MHSARVAHAHGTGSAHVHSVCVAHSQAGALAGLASACVARDGVAHAGVVTAPGRASRRGWR
jgi:hypothetical protein